MMMQMHKYSAVQAELELAQKEKASKEESIRKLYLILVLQKLLRTLWMTINQNYFVFILEKPNMRML